MSQDGLTESELGEQGGEPLPAREVMTLISPSAGSALLPGVGESDPASAGGAAPGHDSATTTAGATADQASHFSPPPSDGAYTPTATSSSTT
jgi:hypothetical protein